MKNKIYWKTEIAKYKWGGKGVNFFDVIVKTKTGRYRKRITTTSMKEAREIANKIKSRRKL